MPYRTRLTGQLALLSCKGHESAPRAIKGNKILKLPMQNGADLFLFFRKSCASRHENFREQAWSEAEIWVQTARNPFETGRARTGR